MVARHVTGTGSLFMRGGRESHHAFEEVAFAVCDAHGCDFPQFVGVERSRHRFVRVGVFLPATNERTAANFLIIIIIIITPTSTKPQA